MVSAKLMGDPCVIFGLSSTMEGCGCPQSARLGDLTEASSDRFPLKPQEHGWRIAHAVAIDRKADVPNI